MRGKKHRLQEESSGKEAMKAFKASLCAKYDVPLGILDTQAHKHNFTQTCLG